MKKYLAGIALLIVFLGTLSFNLGGESKLSQKYFSETEPETKLMLFAEPINGIKENDVTNYYRGPDAIAKLRLTTVQASNLANLGFANTFGDVRSEEARSVRWSPDGSFIVAGLTTSFGAGSADVLVMKIDSKGNLIWAKTFGGPRDDEARSITQSPDGSFIVAGLTTSFGAGSADVLVMKIDSKGNLIWAKTFGGPRDDEARSITQSPDGSFIVAGLTTSFGAGSADVLVMKIDSKGNLIPDCSYLKGVNPITSLITPSFAIPAIIIAEFSPFAYNPKIIVNSPIVLFYTICKSSLNSVTVSSGQISIMLKVNSPCMIISSKLNSIYVYGSMPIIKHQRAFVSVRPIVNAMGGVISWDKIERKITIVINNKTIEFWIGKNIAQVNGVPTRIDKDDPSVVPEIVGETSLIPIRFFVENIDAKIVWDGNTQTIAIIYGH
jgi:hypothetical protein